MNNQRTKSSLSPAQNQLLDLMAEINFGRIEQLVVRGGEPVLQPPPKVVRKIKLGADNGPRQERDGRDFLLKEKVQEFFGHLEDLGTGTVMRIEVQAGLPFSMEIEESAG